MNSRTLHYRKSRIARWTTRLGREFPFTTELELEIAQGLGTLPWYMCHDRDVIETYFFVFMETPISLKPKDQQYYYGRICITSLVLYANAQHQMKVLGREVEEILCELFELIKEDVGKKKITGRVWKHARNDKIGGSNEKSSTNPS